MANPKSRRRRKKKKFRSLRCAPKRKKDKTQKSCYTKGSIEHIRNAWNLKYPQEKIKDTDPYKVWKALKERLQNACQNEKCWLNQEFMKNNLNAQLLTYSFAPKQPVEWLADPNTWLSNEDIKKVMSQYEHVYKKFVFIGPTPIDFDTRVYRQKCVWQELCDFQLDRYHGKKSVIGIIFNTDVHSGGGIHWIAAVIHLKHGYICYFDSLGKPIKPQVKDFIDRIMKQGNDLNITFNYIENKFQHQKTNTECGLYTMYFLIESLFSDATKMKKFCETPISDNKMMKLRGILYNKMDGDDNL